MNSRKRRERIQHAPAPLDRFKPKGEKPQLVQQVQASEVIDNAPQTIGTEPDRVKRTGADAKALRWWNDGPDAVVLGGNAVTVDGGGVVIEANSGFLEETAPNAEWWAVSEGTSKLRLQVLK